MENQVPNDQRQVPIEQRSDDVLPNLGCSLSIWKEAVKRDISHRNNKEKYFAALSTIFFVPENPEGARAVTDAFNQRVELIKKMYEEANNKDDELDSMDQDFKDALLVHVILSKKLQLGDDSNIEPVNNGLTADAVEQACQAKGWKGQVTVDLSDIDRVPEEVRMMKSRRRLPNLFRYDHWKDLTKPAILIIDGSDKHAAEELGFFEPGLALYSRGDNRKIQRVLMRASEGIQNFAPNVGSDFRQDWDKCESVNSLRKIDSKPPEPFDEERFIKLAEILDGAVKRIKKGEKIVLQARNGYGKTTAFKGLTRLLEEQNRSDLSFLFVQSNGTLTNINLEEVKAEKLVEQGVDTIIVDETGRENISVSNARQILEEAEQKGIKVLRTYPGNVTPPEGYEIIKVE